MYDAETLAESIVWAEGGRARLGVSGHYHVNCVHSYVGRHRFQVSLMDVLLFGWRRHLKGQ